MSLKKVQVLIALLLTVLFLLIYLDDTTQDNNNLHIDDDKVELSKEFYGYQLELLRNTTFPGVDNYTFYSVERLGLKPLKGSPLRPDFGPVLNDVTSFRYVKDIKRKCQNGTTSLFIAIISAPVNIGKRNAIRETWLRRLNKETAVHAFIIGQTSYSRAFQARIDKEIEAHGDIIQVDMMDSYYNLTLKVTSLLNWLDKSCHLVDFVLKVDDDVYVNVNNLTGLVKDLSPFRHIPSIYGFRSSSPPLRGGTKWSISYEDWPWSAYPPFFMGAGILMTGTAIRPLLAAAQTVPFMPFDDVYLTGLCSLKADIELWTSERIFDDVASFQPNGCFIQFTTTWSTYSIRHLKSSEMEVDLFYRNVTQCPVHLVTHDHFVPIESYAIQ